MEVQYCNECGYPIRSNPVTLDGASYHEECLTADLSKNTKYPKVGKDTQTTKDIEQVPEEVEHIDTVGSLIPASSVNHQALNPWVSMWTKPRVTIQQIIDTDPERWVLVLAALSGISYTLSDRLGAGGEHAWPVIIGGATIVGPIIGIIFLYIIAALVRWTGKWIGGQASAKHLRAAYAWSQIPLIWGLALWIPGVALFGQEMFSTEMPRVEANLNLAFLYFGFMLIEGVIAIWAMVVYLKCIGQVQGFSAWKALGNISLAMLVVLGPFIIIGIIAVATK